MRRACVGPVGQGALKPSSAQVPMDGRMTAFPPGATRIGLVSKTLGFADSTASPSSTTRRAPKEVDH